MAPFDRYTWHGLTDIANDNGEGSIIEDNVDAGGYDPSIIASRTLDKYNFDCSHRGENTVTLSITDQNGYSASGTAIVTVVDTLKPVVLTKNHTLYLNANGEGSITLDDIDNVSYDNCTIVSKVLSQYNFYCSQIGENTITLSVSDESGNVGTNTTIVTVLDTISPVALTKDFTLYLDENGEGSITANDIDNGSYDNCTIVTKELNQYDFDCSHLGENTVTLTVTDQSGNIGTNTAIVTVLDTISPVVLTKDYMLYLDANGEGSITVDNVDNGSYDNCTIVSRALSQYDYNCSHLGENTVTLTVKDQSGNVGTNTAIITVLDTLKPVVLTKDQTLYLDVNGQGSITIDEIDNDSYDNCTIVSRDLDQYDFDCSHLGENTVTLSVTDESGNVGTNTAALTVLDTISPTVLTKNFTLYLDVNGVGSISVDDINNGSFDNCTIVSLELDQYDFDCSHMGENVIVLTAKDQSGNKTTATSSVLVQDNIKPLLDISDLTVSLDENGMVTVTSDDVDNGSYDNCEITSFEMDKSQFNCDDLGENTVTITAEDVADNVTTATISVSIEKGTWYRDIDNDGFGDENDATSECIRPEGFISIKGDCNDNDASIYPGATEIANDSIDQDCDGEDLIITSLEDLTNEGNETFAKIYPNTFTNRATIEIQTEIERRIHIEVINIIGLTIKRTEVSIPEGKNTIDQDLQSLKSGTYILRLSDLENEASFSYKLVKK